MHFNLVDFLMQPINVCEYSTRLTMQLRDSAHLFNAKTGW